MRDDLVVSVEFEDERELADQARGRQALRARSGLTTEQLISSGRAAGWLLVSALEPR
jgi:hypothetical protein